ncbi:hypothetical protein M378DRAFT_312427 [Amanita muscaria Koide BX008]|uniref:Uncharacterized protein n=1 Tax=Amanita muscaria (strain Koide BX008) TaxID=946122 RepID=A0A0C2SWV7_AMAMK|nr:hypothetical protein M378DRAFT_312427 [Amanita muscaria Koide BX008]
MMYCVRGAILIGIFLTAIISWPRSMAVTYFPYTATGDEKFNFFKQVLTFRKLEKFGNALDHDYKNGHVWYALITFLYVDILDTTGHSLFCINIFLANLCIHTFVGYWRRTLHVTRLRIEEVLSSVTEVNWNYIGDVVPAFLTLIIIPLTYKTVLLSCSSVFRTLNSTSNAQVARQRTSRG